MGAKFYFLMLMALMTTKITPSIPAAEDGHQNEKEMNAAHNRTIELPEDTSNYGRENIRTEIFDNRTDMVQHNNRSITRKSEISAQPMNDSGKCILSIERPIIEAFRHTVQKDKSNFMYLNLTGAEGVQLKKGKYTIAANIWVWTFWGKEGALEYLHWPTEFGIWSMGLLYESVTYRPVPIELSRVSGNCSNIQVGNNEDDRIIAAAFTNLTLEMINYKKDVYGPSFYCYMERIIIGPYQFCKHLVCPLEAVTFSCCNFFYNTTKRRRVMDCPNLVFDYDPMWWILPSIISIVLFAYSPLLFLYIFHKLSEKEIIRFPVPSTVINIQDHGPLQPLLHGKTTDFILLQGKNHVTFLSTVLSPLASCKSPFDGTCLQKLQSRIVRILIPVFTFSIIGLQILLDYHFLSNFVKDCVASGVPLGFRSMLTGYQKSKINFLPTLGGPFIASGCYFMVTIALLVVPDSPIQLLNKGIHWANPSYETSPLSLKARTIGLFGAVSLESTHPYHNIYSYLLAEFYMIMNKKFWAYCIKLQIKRWASINKCKLCLLLLPFYFAISIVELCLTLLLHGLPIVSFGFVVIKGYCKALIRAGNRIGDVLCAYIFSMLLAALVFYFLFMFCTIFLDAILFFCRVAIFSFTGVIIFPKTAYGYMIFGFTIFYYLWDSLENFSMNYKKLLKHTMKAVEYFGGPDNDCLKKVMYIINGQKGIRESLFELVIETHRPRRKQVFSTLLQTGVLLGILFFLIYLLIKTDTFRELHVIMHVGTALFICALPTLFRRICSKNEERLENKRQAQRVMETVKIYMEYFEDEPSSIAEEQLASDADV